MSGKRAALSRWRRAQIEPQRGGCAGGEGWRRSRTLVWAAVLGVVTVIALGLTGSPTTAYARPTIDVAKTVLVDRPFTVKTSGWKHSRRLRLLYGARRSDNLSILATATVRRGRATITATVPRGSTIGRMALLIVDPDHLRINGPSTNVFVRPFPRSEMITLDPQAGTAGPHRIGQSTESDITAVEGRPDDRVAAMGGLQLHYSCGATCYRIYVLNPSTGRFVAFVTNDPHYRTPNDTTIDSPFFEAAMHERGRQGSMCGQSAIEVRTRAASLHVVSMEGLTVSGLELALPGGFALTC